MSEHCANTPMQYTALFHGCKNVHFQIKKNLIFAQNIDRSNEYQRSMFWSKNKKKLYTPVNPSFTILK